MNTANLQLEGLLVALAALLDALQRKGLLTREELDAALSEAEAAAAADPRRPQEVSAANRDAVCFPIRFLRLAAAGSGGSRGFTDIAALVGQTKPER
jgi:hypothetical protein